jgi:hypothetical protein
MEKKRTIVFVCESMLPRVSRIVKWVRRSDKFRTILIVHKRQFLSEFSTHEWDEVYLFRNEFHLKRIVKKLKSADLIHAFAPKSRYPDIVRRFVRIPFLIDYQDVLLNYYGDQPHLKWIQNEIPHERNCLLLSDGITAHSLEVKIVLRKLKATARQILFFPVYCDNDYFQNAPKTFSNDAIHLVYAGGVAGSFRNKAHFGSIQFHDLIKTLSAQRIHFHIYPSPANFKGDLDEYKAISEENPWFHFHEPVNQEDLHRELSKYHFGIIPFFKKDAGLSLEKTKYATALKLFNYIEAGLPVIVSRDVYYQSWITERYKAGIVIQSDDIPMLRHRIEQTDYSSLVRQLVEQREKISLQRHIPRLIAFYERVISTYGK